MLGTGQATVTKCYNTCFVLRKNDKYFMVDAGGGNQILRILEEQGISLTQIHDLFVTHAHPDHMLGVVWIIRMIGQLLLSNKYDGNLKIYANEEVVENLQTICKIVLERKITDLFGKRFIFIKLNNGISHNILDKKIIFFDIKSTKLIQYGFKIIEDNLLFCGDEPLKKEFYDYATGLEYLIHEAFCLYSEREKFRPYEKHHSTVKDVCSMAEDLNVKNLLLTHTEDSHIQDRKKLYLNEGKIFYSGNLMIPDDGESIALEK